MQKDIPPYLTDYSTSIQPIELAEARQVCESYAVEIMDGIELENASVSGFEIYDERGKSIGLSMIVNDPDGYEEHYNLIEDFDKTGNKVGEGVVALYPNSNENIKEYRRGFPFVGDTITRTEFQKQGWGRRRLFMFNEFAKNKYGQTLSSDPRGQTEPEAASLWKKLAQEGIAEEVERNGKITWRFIS